MEKKINWDELGWMDENKAEDFLSKQYWSIPDEWMDPQFRMKVLWDSRAVAVDAHINWWKQAYSDRLWWDKNAASVWYQRNIDWQWF